MKKVISLCLIIVIVGSFITLAGCSEKNNAQVEPTQDIQSEFEIGNEKIKLAELSILSDKVNLLIPESFSLMSEEMAEAKYPSGNRPTIIYTNESASVNIALSHTENKATESQIKDYLDSIIQSFKNLYPSAEWFNSDVIVINGKNIGYIELLTPAIDTEIYNLMWFTDLDGKLLITTFNCTKEQMEDWKPVAKMIMDSQRYI